MATPTERTITDRYVRLIRKATPAQLEAGSRWYDDARELARTLVDIHNAQSWGELWTLDTAAAVIAAYSPNMRWSDNVRRAVAHASGQYVFGIYATPEKLAAIDTHGRGALTGPKVTAFAANIVGDEQAVTIDIWMARAAKLASDQPTPVQYRTCVNALRKAAHRTGLTPATAQAVIWCVIRGSEA